MIRYVIKRILLCIPVLICASLIIFVAMSFAPGDAIRWTPTITAQGNDGLQFIMEEG